MGEAKICFKVTFTPKAGWVDEIFLGNMLVEVLGLVRQKYGSFDFEVSRFEQG